MEVMSKVQHVFGNCVFVFCEALQMDHASLLKQFEHLDPHNQNTFEAKDLELLISTVRSFSDKLETVFLLAPESVKVFPSC